MKHCYLNDSLDGQHYAVGIGSVLDKIVLLQIQDKYTQARIKLTSKQARELASLLLDRASLAEEKPSFDEWIQRVYVQMVSLGYSMDEVNPNDFKHCYESGLTPIEAIKDGKPSIVN